MLIGYLRVPGCADALSGRAGKAAAAGWIAVLHGHVEIPSGIFKSILNRFGSRGPFGPLRRQSEDN
jgi:hypothetical protein